MITRYVLRLLILAAILALTIFLTARKWSAASCCEDFRESSYSITTEQLADFGFGIIGWNYAHVAPLAFTERAMRISECESTHRPEAVNPTGCMGLFQICRDSATRRLVQNMGYQWAQLLDPDVNLEVAIAWWRATGYNWSHWECE